MFATALRFLGSLPPALLAALLFLLTCLVGMLDYLVSADATFVSLYLIPMSLAAWFLGLPFSYVIAGMSTALWVISDADIVVRLDASTVIWNLISRFAVFIADDGATLTTFDK